jgi:hypothetical protein
MSKTLGFILCVCVALILSFNAQAHSTYPHQDEINALATSITGQIVVVHCTNIPAKYSGYTEQTETDGVSSFAPEIWVQRYNCYWLNRMMRYRTRRYVKSSTWADDATVGMGTALLTIVHESGHIKLNNGNEGIVECWAVHHMRGVLAGFNLPASVANGVYWAAKRIHEASEAEYRSVC